MTDLDARRRYFSEEIAICYNLQTRALIDALATIAREDFLPPGPWMIQGAGDVGGLPRPTPDADPKYVSHNVSVAIDPARQLFNGSPSVVVPAIDALGLAAGERVLHVGAALGYYTAILADVVGSHGRVLAFEVDAALAAGAAANLATRAHVRAVHGDASEIGGETFDAIFVSAGVTHPPAAWLDALAVGGRLVVPLTASMPQMRHIGKGWLLLIQKESETSFVVRPLTMVAIYSAVGWRDDALNAELGQALQRTPYLRALRLRRDPHDQGADCWFHGSDFCFKQA